MSGEHLKKEKKHFPFSDFYQVEISHQNANFVNEEFEEDVKIKRVPYPPTYKHEK